MAHMTQIFHAKDCGKMIAGHCTCGLDRIAESVMSNEDTSFTAYEWMCLERAENRATMPQRLFDLGLVESSIGESGHAGEFGLTWSLTEAGHRLLLRRRRGEI